MKRCVVLRGNRVGKSSVVTKSCGFSTSTVRRTDHGDEGVEGESKTNSTLGVGNDGDDIKPPSATIEDKPNESPKALKPRHLPISPLMDPSFLAARQKHHAVKRPPPIKPSTPFQKKLYDNPYARALATPPRACDVTKQVMPSFFLLDFNLMAHPVTKTAYWMPRSLTRKYKLASDDEAEEEGVEEGESAVDINGLGRDLGEESETDSAELERDLELESTADTTEAIPSSSDTGQNPPPSTTLDPELPKIKTPSIGPRVYLSARQLLFQGINVSKSGLNNLSQRFGSHRMSSIKESRYILKGSIWREDMPDFLLELMRRRVTEAVIYLAHLNRLKRGYLIACTDWEDVKRKSQIGGVLWMRGKDTPRSMGDRAGPGEFATLDIMKGSGVRHRVPVHNLERLLGEKHIQELRSKAEWLFKAEMVVLKHKKNTVGVQEMLWKLQGFLAEYGYVDRPGKNLVKKSTVVLRSIFPSPEEDDGRSKRGRRGERQGKRDRGRGRNIRGSDE